MQFWRRARSFFGGVSTPCPPCPKMDMKVDMGAPRVHVVSKSCPPLVPENASVSSFVAWMRITIERSYFHRSQGWTRHALPWEWRAEDLYEQYTEVCKLARRHPLVGYDGFWLQLRAAGCTRRRGDLRVNGSRSRPYMIAIPEQAPTEVAKAVRVAGKASNIVALASKGATLSNMERVRSRKEVTAKAA